MFRDAAESFYCKPQGDLFFASPADSTLTAPCDAASDSRVVEAAIHRLSCAVDLSEIKVRRHWAGLRAFTPDRGPVVGFDADVKGFFWLAGQGGYGIKTAPALAKACAALIDRDGLPEELIEEGVELDALSPGRFR